MVQDVAFATETTNCDHKGEHFGYRDNGDGTHIEYCDDCKTVLNESIAHDYVNGKCVCGAELATCDHMGNKWSYKDNGNGTHNVICEDCGEVVTEAAECVHENGKACVCGSIEEVLCDHVGVQVCIDNRDGKTHTVKCPKCGEVITKKAAHVYDEKTGECACGAKKCTVQAPKLCVVKGTILRRAFVSWKKVKGVNGYKVQYGTKKNFSNAKSIAVYGSSRTTRIISKLKPGKKYYVRVCSIKKNGKALVCSKWSNIKCVKVR